MFDEDPIKKKYLVEYKPLRVIKAELKKKAAEKAEKAKNEVSLPKINAFYKLNEFEPSLKRICLPHNEAFFEFLKYESNN